MHSELELAVVYELYRTAEKSHFETDALNYLKLSLKLKLKSAILRMYDEHDKLLDVQYVYL